MHDVNWALVARLLGGATTNTVRYMDILNRFSFRIASDVIARDLAERVLGRIFDTMMHANESLQQLLGKLCHAGHNESLERRELLRGFCELLERHGVTGVEITAVTRSLESQ